MRVGREQTVLLTDRVRPGDSVERPILEEAGLHVVAGPPDPASDASVATEAVRVLRGEPPRYPFNQPSRSSGGVLS